MQVSRQMVSVRSKYNLFLKYLRIRCHKECGKNLQYSCIVLKTKNFGNDSHTQFHSCININTINSNGTGGGTTKNYGYRELLNFIKNRINFYLF